MTTLPDQYYNRFNASKRYESHLFIAGRALQSAELNEVQFQAAHRLKGVADVLFKDGDVLRDAQARINPATGETVCAAGAVYLQGAVRGISPSSFTVPIVGVVSIGLRLVEAVITDMEDPDLRDPATGTRNYQEAGADRLQVIATWAWGNDGGAGQFYPVYQATNGVLDAKEQPPNLDAITQSLARYDRDSAGGSYVVSGLDVKVLSDIGLVQQYSLAEGRARVYGYGLEFLTSRRVTHAAVPDLKVIANEPTLSTSSAALRVNFARTPGTALGAVSITKQSTKTLTHGVTTGAQDPIPDTSVLSILSVTQGATTFTPVSDYNLTAGKVDWSPTGLEPAPGSTYTVTYLHITLVTPTAVDDYGFTVSGAVSGTLVLSSYSQKLPRIDRLAVSTDGVPVWLIGVAAEFNPQPPVVPLDMLPLASVYQNWTLPRTVVNDGIRVVPMSKLAAVDSRLDWLAQLIAQQRLESSIHAREAGAKKGLFTDPFIDDSQRDAGTVQTAAIVRGELVLPIAATVMQMGTDITGPQTLTFSQVVALDQPYKTSAMLINPYLAFSVVPGKMILIPAVDRWTDVLSQWASPSTKIITSGWGNAAQASTSTRTALLNTATSQISTLRVIPVAYSIAGFGPGEILTSLKFDGLSLPTGGAVANGAGVVSGTFTIPAGIPAGSKMVEAVGGGGTTASAVFTGQGTLEIQTFQQQTLTTVIYFQVDPLAQTFTLKETIQMSGVDLWFAALPSSDVSVQIRTTANGLPTATCLAEKIVKPASLAAVGSSTRISFDAPVTLLAGSEYAVVVLCNDAAGALSVAELGKFDATAQRWMTSQPYNVGVLLSSSNASTWTAHQDRDLAFRILKTSYLATSRTLSLGSVAVTAATDLLLSAFAERPASVTGVSYLLTLPDSTVITVDDGQPVQLSAPITGNIAVSAVLKGDANFSPVLFPGAQLVFGAIGATGTYVSRAILAGTSANIKVIYEAIIPSGGGVTVAYKGPDAGDAWINFGAPTTAPASDGFTEFSHLVTGVTKATVQTRLTLSGSTGARPRVRDLRVIIT